MLGRSYDLSPDGERFLMIKAGRSTGEARKFIVVLNWSEELASLSETSL